MINAKKRKTKGISREELVRMAKESDARVQKIEQAHREKINEINASGHSAKELARLLAEEDIAYQSRKVENEKKNKREIEDIQRQLLDEIKQQYIGEQHAIMREYAAFEAKMKTAFVEKERANMRDYSAKLTTLTQKCNKRLHAYARQSVYVAIPAFEPPTVESILKAATVRPCAELAKIDGEQAKNKKLLREEYKKTKDAWNADEESQIYSSQKELEAEYNSRCARYKTKYSIERFYHVNNCGDCKTANFTYIPIYDPKNKEAATKIGPLTAYFRAASPDAKVQEPNADGSIAPILRPANHDGANTVLADFARQFILAFVDFYNQEIARIRDYEMTVPKEQNLAYTVLHAEKIWTKVKSIKILDLRFNEKTDDEKVADFRKQEDKFYKDFPIVARYMVCLDTYNRTAFRKFLVKLIASNQKKQQRAYSTGLSGANSEDSEDLWIELQADYVKYLYQEYNKSKHLSQAELRGIWKDTYDLLKKEFGDFRKLYDKKVKQIEEEKKQHNAEMAKEVLGRLTTIQTVDNDTQYKLYIEMQNTLYLQRANKTLKELLARCERRTDGIEGRGKSKEVAQQMERDKKMKEAKNKSQQSEPQIKNPVKYYYDSRGKDDDARVFAALRDLCYLHKYHSVQTELIGRLRALAKRKRPKLPTMELEGMGTNAELITKWEDERKKWRDERRHMARPDEKIHIPYTRNLVRMFYDNGCRFEVA